MIIKTFRQLSNSDVLEAGGKGASLGEMVQAGISVPSGFVVLASAFERFLDETDLNIEISSILDQVNHKEIHTIENASERIKALILNAQIPEDITSEIKKGFAELNTKYVAIRSSATAEDSSAAAWAGQLESYLNTTENNLLKNVQRCWASLFTPRAIFYRFDKGLHQEKISVAVVVQKMVQSEVSGIAFSVHPITQDYNQIIIEAGYGLGEAIVSGQITPDSYVVDKTNWNILDKNVFSQQKALIKVDDMNQWVGINKPDQKLSDEEISTLSQLIGKIEKHYNFPVDVEWAKENNEFYILQSRPITTLGKVEYKSIDILQYQRMFELHDLNVYFFISDVFMGHYKTLNALLTYHEGTWTTYLPNLIAEKCLNDGLEIFGNKEKFELYSKDFSRYLSEYTNLIQQALSKQSVTETETKKIFDLASQFFYFYSKTEFFYTDRAFLQSSNNDVLKENLSKLEEIKNSGRETLNKLFFGETSLLYKFLSILAKQFNHKPETLFTYYTRQEISNLFQNQTLDEEKFKQRKAGFIMQGEKDNLVLIEGKEANEIIKNVHSQSLAKINSKHELKGTSANKGKMKGRVKIIPSDYYHDHSKLNYYFANMKKGDILVAETTSPELMPACEKASAIITNQGGLLSHAAIVSREMNIPCIVGVGNATEVLKDDDLIEVDGNTGIIKILESTKTPQFNKEDYILSFWVQGVNVFVTDIHREGYAELEVLYIIDNGLFKQYFTKKAFENSLERGLQFYSDKHAFVDYKSELTANNKSFQEFFEANIKGKNQLSAEVLSKFFEFTAYLCKEYAKMNFEFTDKAFSLRESNKTIANNLDLVSVFKDQVRSFMNTVLFDEQGYLMELFRILNKQFSLSVKVLENLTQKELLDLYNGKIPDETLVLKRQEFFVCIYNNPIPYEGAKAREIAENFREKADKTDQIRGQTARKGKVSGRVKIIPVDYSNFARINTEIEKMKQGDILVAETTAPELIVACKKAGAIVTDMGGLMSHAAIVSREFGIPCIVGTKNATQILKDGDMVEVNADKGVIKIIEKQ